MSQRRNRTTRPVIPISGKQEVKPIKMEKKDISDKSKLVWERFIGPLASAASQMNVALTNAQNIMAQRIIEAEGLNPDEWIFDIDNVQLVKRPEVKKEEG